MAPLPAVVDPNLKRDRLPQPYRLIDKLLAEVLDSSFSKISDLEAERAWQAQWEYEAAFEEDGILLESQQTTCCCITPDGTRLIAGTKDGRVVVTHLKTRKQEAETKLFEKPVTSVAAYNTPTILQADQEAGRSVLQICVCDRLGLAVMYLNNPFSGSNTGEDSDKGSAAPELKELGKAAVPSGKGTNAVSGDVIFSPDGSHIMFTGGSGAAALYKMPADPRQPAAAPLETPFWLTEQSSRDILGVIKQLPLGRCNALWQLTDTSQPGRNKAAKGVYLWWSNFNHLLLLPLTKQPTLCAQSIPEDTPPITEASLEKIGSWVAPELMTALAATTDGATLALGLLDGTVILYSNTAQSPVAVIASVNREHPVEALAFLSARPGYPAGQLLVSTNAPNLRAINLRDLDNCPEPILVQDSVFSIQAVLHAPLVLLMLRNRRAVVFNATEMCVVAELKLQADGRALVAPLKSCAFMLPPKDENGLPVPGADLEEVKPRQVLEAGAFLAVPGASSGVLAVGVSEAQQKSRSPYNQVPEEDGRESGAEEGGTEEHQEGASAEAAPADVPDPIDGDDGNGDAAAGAAKAAKAAGGKSSKAFTPDPAEQKEEIPKRFVHTSVMGGIAVFTLEDINNRLKPEEEDVLGGKPLMIHRMLRELDHPNTGLDPSSGGYHGGGALKNEGGTNKSARFLRGVTPSRTERLVSGEGASGGDASGSKKPSYPQGGNRDYEPSDAGTGLSGISGETGGEGAGARVARPVPGGSAAIAEKVLGKLGDAGGRRTRNRVMRRHMKELSSRLMSEGAGQPMYLAPPAAPIK